MESKESSEDNFRQIKPRISEIIPFNFKILTQQNSRMPSKERAASFISQANESIDGLNGQKSRKSYNSLVPSKSVDDKISRSGVVIDKNSKFNFSLRKELIKSMTKTKPTKTGDSIANRPISLATTSYELEIKRNLTNITTKATSLESNSPLTARLVRRSAWNESNGTNSSSFKPISRPSLTGNQTPSTPNTFETRQSHVGTRIRREGELYGDELNSLNQSNPKSILQQLPKTPVTRPTSSTHPFKKGDRKSHRVYPTDESNYRKQDLQRPFDQDIRFYLSHEEPKPATSSKLETEFRASSDGQARKTYNANAP